MSTEQDYTASSGNVFADLDLPEPEEALLKADLSIEISRTIEQYALTEEQAAERMGLELAQLADLLRGRFADFSTDRLLRLLAALGRDVRITIEPRKGERGTVELVCSG